MKTELRIDGAGDGLLAWARVPRRLQDVPRQPKQSCPEHGWMKPIDTDDFKVELNGVVWGVEPDVVKGEPSAELYVCPACVDEELRTREKRDAGDLELVREAVREEWRNKYRRGQLDTRLFGVEAVTTGATPIYCPYCSDPLDQTSEGDLECRVHGRMTIAIEAERVPDRDPEEVEAEA